MSLQEMVVSMDAFELAPLPIPFKEGWGERGEVNYVISYIQYCPAFKVFNYTYLPGNQ